MEWRDRVTRELRPRAEQAAKSICGDVISVDFDWRNAIFRVLIPESADVNDDEVITAIQAVTGVRAYLDTPPIFPFTLHTRIVPGLMERTNERSWTLPLRLDVRDIAGLRDGYDRLATVAARFPRCVTFALGGLPVLGYIAKSLLPSMSEADTEEGRKKHSTHLLSAQQKFHVHEGLNWSVDNPKPTVKFHKWLASIPPEEPLVTIDTTFTGGGINQIANVVLETRTRPTLIEIHGILDKSRKPLAPDTRDENDMAGRVKTAFHHVPKLITEDENELIGYESLRSMGGLKPLWGAATVEVFDESNLLAVLGTSNVAHTIEELIRAEPPSQAPLNSDFANASRYIALLAKIKNELLWLFDGISRARDSGLIGDDVWLKERQAVLKRLAALKEHGRKAIFKR